MEVKSMEIINIESAITVFVVTAKSFPKDILNAHETLHRIIPFSEERRYFGISRPENGVIVYKAAAEKLEENFDCEIFTIAIGKYKSLTISNFKKDPQGISNAFEKLISQPDIDPNGY